MGNSGRTEVVALSANDKEQALLGILESQLGERQRAMNGLHLNAGVAADTQAEMLQLQRTIQDQFTRQRASQGGRHHGPSRREYPSAVVLAVGLVLSAVCALALVVLVLGA